MKFHGELLEEKFLRALERSHYTVIWHSIQPEAIIDLVEQDHLSGLARFAPAAGLSMLGAWLDWFTKHNTRTTMYRCHRPWLVAGLTVLSGLLLTLAAPQTNNHRVVAETTAAKSIKPPDQYKRIHQKALDLITDGASASAARYLEQFASEHPDDAETEFMLTLAKVGIGNLDQAEAHLRKALELDLPPGRFLAGPRELLQPLAATDLFKQLRTEQPIIHGPMIGAVTESSARLWVRTSGPMKLMVHVAPEGSTIGSRNFPAETTADQDFTATTQLTGLEPVRPYEVHVSSVGSSSRPVLAQARFTTHPPAGSATRFTLAFGGGAGFVPEHESMWNTIASRKPDMLVLLGDNVYIDNPESRPMQRYCYYRRQSRPEYRRLLASAPVYSIWDDHDFGANDCSGGAAIDQPTWKRSVWEVFKQNWGNPGYGSGKEQPGCWYTFIRGDVRFIMLDGRYYRASGGERGGTMLGPAQMAWLKRTLRQSEATFTVLCSPVPWDFRTKGGSFDTWNGFRAERATIFAWLDQFAIDGAVLMSADRHRSDAWRIERPGSYDLFEFNSSRLTNQHVHPEQQAAIFSYNKKQSFGLVTFDTLAADPTVNYEVVTIDGETVHSLQLPRSQLTAPP